MGEWHVSVRVRDREYGVCVCVCAYTGGVGQPAGGTAGGARHTRVGHDHRRGPEWGPIFRCGIPIVDKGTQIWTACFVAPSPILLQRKRAKEVRKR